MIVRVLKGLYMFFMFAVFGIGILIEIIFIFPFMFIIEKIQGRDQLRMQKVHRILFTIWLFLMRIGGLIRSKPSKGHICQKPCVIIANHPGLFDVIFLIKEIPYLSVLVKRSLSRKLPIAPLLRLSGYVLSPDNLTISPVKSLQNAVNRLNNGYKFQIFPEGTRSPVNELLPFHAGAFKIAQSTNVPIQPVLIRNDPPFLPKGTPWYLPPKEISEIELEYLEPIPPPKKDELRKVVKEIEDRYRKELNIEASVK